MLVLLAVIAAAEPLDTVRAFHAALARGDRNAALGLLDPQASIFEAGEVESVQKYTAGHVEADIAFARSTTRTLRHESERRDGDTAVVSQAVVRGAFEAEPVDLVTLESMFLVRTSGAWRIAHIHWSSTRRELASPAPPPAAPPKRLACAPPPEPEQYVGYGQSDPQARCKSARLAYEISAEEMRTGASDPTGRGLCYGIVHFGADGRQTGSSCGAYHCQTLRYCDGRERARYCTIRAVCDNGVAKAVGFTW